VADEELLAKLLLERLDLLRERWLRHMKIPCRTGHVLRLCYRQEVPKRAYLHAYFP
jgi:hypothetical protein